MKIVERVKGFVKNIRESRTKSNTEEKSNNQNKVDEIKEQKIKNRYDKIDKIFNNLKNIKDQLEDKSLSPFKRMILQLKLDFAQTRLDKQLALLDIEDFKDEIVKIKTRMYRNHNDRLAILEDEYDELIDREMELEDEIDEMVESQYEKKHSNTRRAESEKPEDKVYLYEVGLNTMNELEDKKRELEDLMNKRVEKEDEIDNVIDEFHEKEADVDEQVNNKLKKYNPFRLNWESIKAFFSRAKNTIKEWRQNVKASKEENPKVEESLLENKKEENENVIKDFKERINANISLEEQKGYVDEVNNEKPVKEEIEPAKVKTGIQRAHEAWLKAEGRENEIDTEIDNEEKTVEEAVEEIKEPGRVKTGMEVAHEAWLRNNEEKAKENTSSNIEEILEEETTPEVVSDADRLSSLVGPHNLAIRTYQRKIYQLDKLIRRTRDEKEIQNLEDKIAEYENDIEEHRKMRDDKIEMYRQGKEEIENEVEEPQEDYNKVLEEKYNEFMANVEDTPERKANVEKYSRDYEIRQEVMRKQNERVRKILEEKENKAKEDEDEPEI